MENLRQVVSDFCSLQTDPTKKEPGFHLIVRSKIDELCKQIRICEEAGNSRNIIFKTIKPAWEIHRQSPFIKRLQDWPRGYPGDFETIEYICDAENKASANTLAWFLEDYGLNCDAAQQHRNKVRHQAKLIGKALEGREKRVLSIACGGNRDVRSIPPNSLNGSGGELVLNDHDNDALTFSWEVLKDIKGHCKFVPGNIFGSINTLARTGMFDLVVCGGLFDYLTDRQVVFLIHNIQKKLLKEGGTLFFTNFAKGNPFTTWMEYLADWTLIIRSEEQILNLCEAAVISKKGVQIKRDETNLTLLVEFSKGLGF
jgi:extracellular factor (EF) 3-hydroxypalmitic acid methyl ester biosynthesis protein